jgi:hypothetical protein
MKEFDGRSAMFSCYREKIKKASREEEIAWLARRHYWSWT